MRFAPRPDQLEAIESITTQLIDEDRTQAIMACGTGKTFVSQKAAERITAANPDSLILVAVPNLVLVEQMIGEWGRQAAAGHEFATLAVNSRRRGQADEDEITDVGLADVTSDPAEIAEFMMAPGRKVIFSTYQSMAHISTALGLVGAERPGFQLDLMVLDEAHRTAGVTRTDTPTAFKLALDNEQVPAAKRLFMTATPRISKMNRSETATASASMDNPELFGQRAITRSLSWAVSEDLLAPYRTYVVQVDDDMLQASLEANPELRVGGKAAEAQHVAAAIALAKNARINGLGGIITYSSTIAGAQEFGRVLQEIVDTLPADQKPAGRLTVNHINGGTPAEERAQILGTLDSSGREDGDWAVVTNCNCLVEGVNVPSMDAIMFVDPRKSLVSIVQAIGRPMRKDRNNPGKIATILLPVFVGAHENVQAAIDGGAFEHVNQTITALRDVDDALSEKFVDHLVKRGSEDVGEAREPKEALIAFTDAEGELLPGQPENAVIRVTDPAAGSEVRHESMREGVWGEWYRGIETALVDDMTDGWERGLVTLWAFVSREGHANVPDKHIENGRNLGRWVSSRRRAYRMGVMTAAQTAVLEKVPGWVWIVGGPHQDGMRDSLERYILREGNSAVPFRHLEGDKRLGVWVDRMRQIYKKGSMSKEDATWFISLPGWVWDAKEDASLAMRSLLMRYVDREGHPDVPHGHLEAGLPLGKWVSKRRSTYASGRMKNEEETWLVSIPGWIWNVHEAKLEKSLAALKAFVSSSGHSEAPKSHVEDGVNLGTWITARRHRLRKGKLPESQIAALDAISPTWRNGALAPWESAPGVRKDEAQLDDAA